MFVIITVVYSRIECETEYIPSHKTQNLLEICETQMMNVEKLFFVEY